MKPRLAVSLAFMANGCFFAFLACRIPDIQRSLGLNKAQLSLALLSCAAGALVGVSVAGRVCARFGSHRVTIISGLAGCAMLTILSLTQSLGQLSAIFVCFGICTGAMDVAMNTNGVAVEKLLPKPIMSSLHGMFSLGGLVGAAIGGLIVRAGFSVTQHFAVGSLLLAIVLLIVWPFMLKAKLPADHVPPAFAWPERAVLAVGVITFCAFVSEAAMGDWSAIYLRESLHQTPTFSTFGYFAFSLTMTATRFGGDAVLHRWGPTATLRICGLITAIGLGSALLVQLPWYTLVGFGSVGLGMATVAPIAFSLGGRLGGDNPDHAIASIASMGYTAFLVGPPVIGFLAEGFGLRVALCLVVFLAVGIVLLAGFAKPKQAHAGV